MYVERHKNKYLRFDIMGKKIIFYLALAASTTFFVWAQFGIESANEYARGFALGLASGFAIDFAIGFVIGLAGGLVDGYAEAKKPS